MKSCEEKAMEKLLHGHGCASKIKLLMDHPDSSILTEDLAKSVLHCFSDALSDLIDHNDDHHEQSNHLSSPKPHKRQRKTSMAENSDYHRHESPNPIYHDGYHWRKYGQKQIKDANHERSYYKCAYTDRKCEAKKQFQMIRENPPLYSTTYFGRHTCQRHQSNYTNLPIETDFEDELQGGHMIRFDQSQSHDQDHNIKTRSSTFPLPSSFQQEENHVVMNVGKEEEDVDVYMMMYPEEKVEVDWSPSTWMSSDANYEYWTDI